MKLYKNVKLWFFVIFIFLFTGLLNGFEGSALLTQEDLLIEEIDQANGPAISSAADDSDAWSSFNQWMCFDISNVKIEVIQIMVGQEWKEWPQLYIKSHGMNYQFSLDIDHEINAKQVVQEWEEKIKGTHEICLYAAFLQYVTSEDNIVEGLWMLEKFKTDNGYWNLEN